MILTIRRKNSLLAIAALLVLLPLSMGFKVPKNPGDDFAFDATATLSDATRQTIRATNQQIASTGAQVAVAVIPRSEPIALKRQPLRFLGRGALEAAARTTVFCSLSPRKIVN